MPCYDSRNSPDYVRAEAKKEFQADKLTRMLCEAMTKIEVMCYTHPPSKLADDVSKELFDWWTAHKQSDRIRRRGR